MQRPHSIRTKLKQLQRKRFDAEVESYTRICPSNCKNNCVSRMANGREISLCSFGQGGPGEFMDPTKILICDSEKMARACPHYDAKYRTKEDVVARIRLEIPDEKARRERWPDICMLEWVLGDDFHRLSNSDNFKWYVKFILWFIEKLEKAALKLTDKSDHILIKNVKKNEE